MLSAASLVGPLCALVLSFLHFSLRIHSQQYRAYRFHVPLMLLARLVPLFIPALCTCTFLSYPCTSTRKLLPPLFDSTHHCAMLFQSRLDKHSMRLCLAAAKPCRACWPVRVPTNALPGPAAALIRTPPTTLLLHSTLDLGQHFSSFSCMTLVWRPSRMHRLACSHAESSGRPPAHRYMTGSSQLCKCDHIKEREATFESGLVKSWSEKNSWAACGGDGGEGGGIST